MNKLWLFLGKVGYIITRPGVYAIIRFTRRAYVVVRVDGQIIVTKDWLDSHRYWRLPGGGVKRSELPKQGAIRELKEEIGVELPINTLKLVKKGKHPSMKYRFWVYEAILDKKPIIIMNKFELLEVSWHSTSSIKGLPTVHELKSYLDK